jgi:1,2-diacylglycerol-3-alpha-glucose alpha-1,2-glucosyltransferase
MKRYVLAPRPDHERNAQDYFVYDLALLHGLTLLRNDVREHRYPVVAHPPALIVSHNPDHLADARLIGAWGADRNVPIVVHLHCHFNYFQKYGTTDASLVSNRENVELCLRYAHTVVVPAGFMVEDLKSHVPNLRNDLRIEVVSNGARKSLYYPSTFDQRSRFRAGLAKVANVTDQHAIPPDRKLVGFVGRVENAKGLQLLEQLAAAHATSKQLDDVCLLVQFRFQPGSAEHQACMKNAMRLREANQDFIRLYADQAPRGTDRPMRHFDLLLLPSLSEVQPMVALEALSCGVPVVVTRSTKFFDELGKLNFGATEFAAVDLPERLGGGSEGVAELAESDNPGKIARDLIDAIDLVPRYDDAQRAALSNKADLAGFSDATMYQRYLRLYDDAVEDFGGRLSEAVTTSIGGESLKNGGVGLGRLGSPARGS